MSGLDNPSGIAVSSDGVIERGGLSLLSKDGQKVRTIGSDIPDPTAVAVDGTGNIYAVSSGKVFKLNYDGEVKAVSSEQRPSQFGIAVSQSNVFFGGTETEPNIFRPVEILVLKFDTDLKLITSFTVFSIDSKLACDRAGNLCVINLNEVKVLSQDGTALRTITFKGQPVEPLAMKWCTNNKPGHIIHVDYNTYIFVTHSQFPTKQKPNKSIYFALYLYLTKLVHLLPHYNTHCCGITTDEDGFIYICDPRGFITVFH